MAITTLLIANRGEIAVRIIRAARELGIRTVQVHSEADSNSLAVRMADEAVDIGPPQVSRSYMNAGAILEAAASAGADAIHPGYGFFAENADFADAVESAGMSFVGPSGGTIRLMADKVAARKAAVSAGVPTVPGSADRLDGDMKAALAVVEETGFPVMIKAAGGGGGRGIRIASDVQEFERFLPQARAEAAAAFGDGGLYLEKVIGCARHIEVQVLGDGARVVHCFERDCSLQRRRQKLWEEAPAPRLPESVREELYAAAVALAGSVGYRGAGTVEFLYDDATEEFFFIEMNTRIQVEHPVTELITGVDLVREMIRIAAGEPLQLDQGGIGVRGHAIEVRINAENPAQDFMPSLGAVGGLKVPDGPGVRFDTLLYPGYEVSPFYDSLLGKLIVWDETRSSAMERLRRALGELDIEGIRTTQPLFQALADDEEVRAGMFDTRWLERWLGRNAARLE